MFKTAVFSASLLATTILIPQSVIAADAGPTWAKEVAAINNVTGQSFEYAVSGYRIRLDFIAANRIRWTRVEAPDGTAGQTGEEDMVHTDLRPGVFMIAFTEAEGNVVDAFDLQRKRLFVTYITNDKKRFHSVTTFKVVTP